jgi:hypothetical protein
MHRALLVWMKAAPPPAQIEASRPAFDVGQPGG